MRLTPKEPEIPHVGGFTPDNDIFGYRDFAERLANLVRNIDEPLVVALDGPWGSGKTIFVRQWAGLLRERGATVIQFDAFGNDHHEDAFLAIAAEIHFVARETLGGSAPTTRKYFNMAKKVGIALTPMAIRIGTRVGTAGVLGLEDVKASGDAAKEVAKALGDEARKAAEKAVSERLRKADADRATLETFRTTLADVAHAVAEQSPRDGSAYPLVFIIDELDRCRPPFALSIIERIKHLFSVEGVCFVLVTNLAQLETAVQGAYGTVFDGHEYLQKFYHLPVTLPENTDQWVRHRATYVNYLWKALGIEFENASLGQLVQEQLVALADVDDLSLRQIERVLTNVTLVSAAASQRSPTIPPLIAGLCIMRLTNPPLYRRARAGELTWEEARSFLQPKEGASIHDDWTLRWWRYATGDEMSEEESQSCGRGLYQYGIELRTQLLPRMATYIDSLAQRRGGSGEQ